MDEIPTPRIEPSSSGSALDRGTPLSEPQKKRKLPEKPAPLPELESDDPVEDIHQIDELT